MDCDDVGGSEQMQWTPGGGQPKLVDLREKSDLFHSSTFRYNRYAAGYHFTTMAKALYFRYFKIYSLLGKLQRFLTSLKKKSLCVFLTSLEKKSLCARMVSRATQPSYALPTCHLPQIRRIGPP